MQINKAKIFKKIKIKDILIMIAIVASLALFAIFVVGNNAVPGNPFYRLDRSIENIEYKLQPNNEARLSYQVGLADERLMEQRTFREDPLITQQLLNDYSNNLKEIKSLYAKILEEQGSNNDTAQGAIALSDTKATRWANILITRSDNSDNREVKRLYTRATNATTRFGDDIFGMAVVVIVDNEQFDQFGLRRLVDMVRVVDKEIDYAIEDITVVRSQATEEEIKFMTDTVNEARDIFDNAKNSIGTISNKEVYEQFEITMDKIEIISEKLVEITTSTTKPTPIPTTE